MSGEGNLSANEALLKVINSSGAGDLKLAFGTTTGAATTTQATGLTTVLGCCAQLGGDPVDTCMHATAAISSTAGAIDIKTWKSTDGDATLIAATTPFVDINWIAIGR